MDQAAPASLIILFGITGDLAQRYLLPGLHRLLLEGHLDSQSIILGVSRRDVSANDIVEQYQQSEHAAATDEIAISKLRQSLRMQTMDLGAADDYDQLLQTINSLEDEQGTCLTRLYYLSVPPASIAEITELLGEHGHAAGCQHNSAASRILIEKPFGYDLASAQELLRRMSTHFAENQLYRIDHYLAKDAVQSFVSLRTHNPVLASFWNATHIKQIIITAAEAIAIEGRAAFYEEVGALRDFIQNHLLQLLAVTLMNAATADGTEDLHQAKLMVLRSLITPDAASVQQQALRGQYNGYRDDAANPTSHTETFAQLTLYSEDTRWQGTPFVLRTGKALNQKLTEIRLDFKAEQSVEAGSLSIQIQPEQQTTVRLVGKLPGFSDQPAIQTLSDDIDAEWPNQRQPDAYERVFADAARGNRQLFVSANEVLRSWEIVQPVLDNWLSSDEGLISYEKGSSVQDIIRQAPTEE